MAAPPTRQVTVTQLQWGRVSTGDLGVYKDAIVHDRSEEWNWVAFGLSHDPGYTASVVRAIRSYMVKSTTQQFRARRPTIYLSTGQDQKIQVPGPDDDSQIVYLESRASVAAYNADVLAGRACILFLHSTC
jgi:hypothetical protein